MLWCRDEIWAAIIYYCRMLLVLYERQSLSRSIEQGTDSWPIIATSLMEATLRIANCLAFLPVWCNLLECVLYCANYRLNSVDLYITFRPRHILMNCMQTFLWPHWNHLFHFGTRRSFIPIDNVSLFISRHRTIVLMFDKCCVGLYAWITALNEPFGLVLAISVCL